MQNENFIRRLLIIGFILMQAIACVKEEPEPKLKPELEYLDYILAGQTAGIGIIYSGIQNYTLLFKHPSSDEIRLIDINNDGTDDFELKHSGSQSPGQNSAMNYIIPLNNNALVTPYFNTNIVDTISLNDTIGENLNWVNSGCIIYKYSWENYGGPSTETGLWENLKGKYIGAKVLIDNEVLYTWLRIETDGKSLTLIDFASTIGYEN